MSQRRPPNHRARDWRSQQTYRRSYRASKWRSLSRLRPLLLLGAAIALIAFQAKPDMISGRLFVAQSPDDSANVEQSAFYRNCAAARAAGAAPIYDGSPGYRPELDRDDDGIACEPYRGQ